MTLTPFPTDTKCLEQANLVYKDNTKAFWFSKNDFLWILRRENNTNGGHLTIWQGISSISTLVNRSHHSFLYSLLLLLLFRLANRSLAFLNASIYHSSGAKKSRCWTKLDKWKKHRTQSWSRRILRVIPGLETGCISSCSITQLSKCCILPTLSGKKQNKVQKPVLQHVSREI